MSAEFFIDTKLFIYPLETADPAKAAVAERIIRAGIETGNACISFQVVQECLNTILHKAEISLNTEQASQYLGPRCYGSIPASPSTSAVW